MPVVYRRSWPCLEGCLPRAASPPAREGRHSVCRRGQLAPVGAAPAPVEPATELARHMPLFPSRLELPSPDKSSAARAGFRELPVLRGFERVEPESVVRVFHHIVFAYRVQFFTPSLPHTLNSLSSLSGTHLCTVPSHTQHIHGSATPLVGRRRPNSDLQLRARA